MIFKKNKISYLTIFILSLTSVAASDKNYISSSFSELYERDQIIEDGDRLVKRGLYDEALNKYKEALNPKLITRESDKGQAIGRMTSVLVLLERYDEALFEWNWYLEQSEKNANRLGKPNNGEAQLEAQKIKALKNYKETGKSEFIYNYIKLYKEKKFKLLPPSFEWSAGPTEVSTVIRLYDIIGDHDAGIVFIDEILDWAYKKEDEKEIGQLKGRINTSEEADTCLNLERVKAQEKGYDHSACKWLREYLRVREAFEQDKIAGTKGRATKVLIQSDYFPW